MKSKLILLIFLLNSMLVHAQITGATNVSVGDQVQYTLNNGVGYLTAIWSVQGGGTVISQWSVGAAYYAVIAWESPGATTINFIDQTYTVRGTLAVTVNLAVPNTTFTVVQNCGSTTVTRNSNPPSGANWYWQTSPSGTSTTLGNASSINRTSAGALYLRARQGTTGPWSTNSQSVGSVSIVSSTPVSASSTDGNVISEVAAAVPLSVSSVNGATSYRWYTQASGGTAISGPTSANYSPTISPSSSQTYYVEAVTGNCASTTRRAVTGYAHPVPIIQVSNGGDVSHNGSVMLTVSNYSYTTYQWMRNGVDIVGQTSSTHVTSTLGTYRVRVTKGNSSPTLSVGPGTSVSSQNYSIGQMIQRSGVTTEGTIDTLGAFSMSQTVNYVDGLGRPVQSVIRKGSPLKYDIVQPIDYDPMGREAIKYMPYVSTSSDGAYKPNAIGTPSSTLGGAVSYAGSPHALYYSNGLSDKVTDDTKPFAETRFLPDPLGRPVKQGSPGVDWQPDGTNTYASSDHTVKFSYEANSSNEVRSFEYTPPTTSTTLKLVPVGYYDSGRLFKTRTKDEQGNELIEFKDQAGKVILKKVQAPGGIWADTYYIYDNTGNLVVVLPPEAVKLFN